MKNLFLIFVVLGIAVRAAAAPDDLVPRGSGLYDAVAVLAQKHLLAADAPDATDLLGVTGRLYTRAEFAAFVRNITAEPTDAQGLAALFFARNLLSPDLGELSDEGDEATPPQTSLGLTGFIEPEIGGHNDAGNSLHHYGDIFGRARLLGGLGRDGAYTVSVTNIYTQTRNHGSFRTTAGGQGADNPSALNGLDEAYVTAANNHGLRGTVGYVRRRWGSGYRGDLLVDDNAPSHPSVQIEFPFSLGHTLGTYQFTQFEEAYRNLGRTIYQGGRRLEHPLGDRVSLSAEENYTSTEFHNPSVLILPFYAFQRLAYKGPDEPNFFNYNGNLGLVLRPDGPDSPARLYGQFFIDDIKAPPGLGQKTVTPRKIAYLVGYAQTFPRSGTDAVVEYTRADRETYTKPLADQAALALFSGDLPQGSPVGPNGQEVFLRLGQRLSPRLSLAVEARDRRRVSNDFPAPNDRSLDLAVAYHLSAAQSFGLRFSQYDEDPFPGVYVSPFSNAPAAIAVGGGADYGQRLRRRLLGISFLQAF